MAELGRDDEVIAWARRGIDQTTGWQTDQLYDLACAAHSRRGERSRRSRCDARSTSGPRPAPPTECCAPPPRRSMSGPSRAKPRAGCSESATPPGWSTHCSTTATTSSPGRRPRRCRAGPRRRLAAAGGGASEERAGAGTPGLLAAHRRAPLETADRRAYAGAVRLLKRARDAAAAGGEVQAFEARLLALRDRHRRRPSLIAMLDKAKLGSSVPTD